MNKRVYFRADGNTLIGLGHLTRCLALGQMLQSAFEVIFVCKEITQDFILTLKKISIKLALIKEEDQFFQLLNPNDFVVLDHYGLDVGYQIKIKKIGCRLICIDDLHDKEFFADLIINHAPNVDISAYKARYYTQFAIGLDYVLLRPIFLHGSELHRVTKKEKSLFVCFGGSDSKNLTQKLVELLKKDTRFKSIDLVVGSAYNQPKQLMKSLDGDVRFRVHIAIDAEKMAELISSSAVVIVPASGILQEAIALHANIISGIYVDNQKNIFEDYKKLGAFVSAEDFSAEATGQAINTILSGHRSKTSLIDGRSGERLLNYFKQFLLEDEVEIKNADATNLLQTFAWANDRALRRFFFNSNAISFEEHQKWYLKKILDESCVYYIGWLDNKAFGSIRFDFVEDVATVSYLIDSGFQGKGLGTILLKKGLDLLIKQTKNKVKVIRGEVMFDNVPSIKVFQKLGYKMTINEEERLYKFEKVIQC